MLLLLLIIIVPLIVPIVTQSSYYISSDYDLCRHVSCTFGQYCRNGFCIAQNSPGTNTIYANGYYGGGNALYGNSAFGDGMLLNSIYCKSIVSSCDQLCVTL